jgi:hypothetical protein
MKTLRCINRKRQWFRKIVCRKIQSLDARTTARASPANYTLKNI